MIRTAFILGAGLGTRLRPLTEHCPKPLLPVAGKPMLCHAMDRLAGLGVERFIINTHHCASAYANAFPGGVYAGRPVLFVHEPVLLDTGGGLKNIEPLLDERDHSLFVCNGDIFAAPDLGKLARAHLDSTALATLLLRSTGEPRNVRLGADGSVLDMRGRLGKKGGTPCLFSGIYCVRREFFAKLEPGKIESVVEAFLRSIEAAPGSIRGVCDDSGHWHDLGTVAEYERVCAAFEFPARAPIEKGGSGRQFFRVALADDSSAVLCRYDESREENALYAEIAAFLDSLGFPVPRVLAEASAARWLLLEDLGAVDLWALRDAPWPERRAAYQSALLALHRLHHTGFARWSAAGCRLMPGFDAALYRWEREYFLENAVRRQAGLPLTAGETAALKSELAALAERLLRLPVQLVHRDCQSQNILWHKGSAHFIDFQGMRTGTGFYDLGSLLWDPYVNFSEDERATLLEFYRTLGPADIARADFEQAFLDASAQRLMQALGAYGFLGIVKGRADFLAHTPSALANLCAVTRTNPALPLLHALAVRFDEARF
jgi:aminoglycoside/choline kinase family phosphotransferase